MVYVQQSKALWNPVHLLWDILVHVYAVWLPYTKKEDGANEIQLAIDTLRHTVIIQVVLAITINDISSNISSVNYLPYNNTKQIDLPNGYSITNTACKWKYYILW